jgi:hypothetical protein
VRSKWDIREILQKNAVTVMFVVLCIIGLICSGQTVSYVMYELFGRLSRNAFIVLDETDYDAVDEPGDETSDDDTEYDYDYDYDLEEY